MALPGWEVDDSWDELKPVGILYRTASAYVVACEGLPLTDPRTVPTKLVDAVIAGKISAAEMPIPKSMVDAFQKEMQAGGLGAVDNSKAYDVLRLVNSEKRLEKALSGSVEGTELWRLLPSNVAVFFLRRFAAIQKAAADEKAKALAVKKEELAMKLAEVLEGIDDAACSSSEMGVSNGAHGEECC